MIVVSRRDERLTPDRFQAITTQTVRNHLRARPEALLRNVAEWERAENSALAAARLPLLP